MLIYYDNDGHVMFRGCYPPPIPLSLFDIPFCMYLIKDLTRVVWFYLYLVFRPHASSLSEVLLG